MPELTLPPSVVESKILLPQGENKAWSFNKLEIDLFHEQGLTGRDTKVAVIDTASDDTHPDLANRIVDSINLTNELSIPHHGHGIQVCGIIGANANDIGVVGIAPDTSILAIKAMTESGGGDYKSLVDALYHASEWGADVINISLGGLRDDSALKTAVEFAVNRGCIVVSAAGNSGRDNSVMYPGRHDQVICVGATNKRNKVSAFSSRGWELDIAAPGERLLTTTLEHGYARVSGTSFSAPVVSGIALLLKQAGIRLTHDLLKETAIDIGTSGEDTSSGYGLINPIKMLTSSKTKVSNDEIDYTLAKNALYSLTKFLQSRGEIIS